MTGPSLLWSCEEAQAFDRHLQEEGGLPAALLMENAGAALGRSIRGALAELGTHRVLALIGPGNNGGDVLVAARQLHPEVALDLRAPLPLGRKSEGPSQQALEAALSIGLEISERPLEAADLAAGPLVVDGLFGIGLGRAVEGAAAAALEIVDHSGAAVLAVDVPSGMDCDSGDPLGRALPARWTLSFVGWKAGFATASGSRLAGRVRVAGIGVSQAYAEDWLRRRRAHREVAPPARSGPPPARD